LRGFKRKVRSNDGFGVIDDAAQGYRPVTLPIVRLKATESGPPSDVLVRELRKRGNVDRHLRARRP
jgi:hypothetical protein